MTTYHINIAVTRATMERVYKVEASSKEEAIQIYNSGLAECISESLIDDECDDPELEDVEEQA